MGLFDAMNAASSGVQVSQTWMDATSDNIANMNTVRPGGQAPFRAEEVVAQSLPGMGGVTVAGVESKGGDPTVTYDPTSPLADSSGNVTQPVVDLSEEMTNMIISNRLYQANLSMMSAAKQSYQAALQIGKS